MSGLCRQIYLLCAPAAVHRRLITPYQGRLNHTTIIVEHSGDRTIRHCAIHSTRSNRSSSPARFQVRGCPSPMAGTPRELEVVDARVGVWNRQSLLESGVKTWLRIPPAQRALNGQPVQCFILASGVQGCSLHEGAEARGIDNPSRSGPSRSARSADYACPHKSYTGGNAWHVHRVHPLTAQTDGLRSPLPQTAP